MRKFAFRKWDVVRERTTEGKPIVGRVIGFGASAGHDWYKVAAGGDVYNARDDELELIRRGPAGREFPPTDESELGRHMLIWRPMSVEPPKDAECIVIWTRSKTGEREYDLLRWNGEGWVMVLKRDSGLSEEFVIHKDVIRAWSLWEWPETD